MRLRVITLLVLLCISIIAGLWFTTAQEGNTPEFGSNWTAVFFNDPDLTGSIHATVALPAGINFQWSEGAPTEDGSLVPIWDCPGAQWRDIPCSNGFSARFTSTQQMVGGTYVFTATADDGVRVFINGAVVLDRFVARLQSTDQFEITLPSGPALIVVEYFDRASQSQTEYNLAMIRFEWTPGTLVPTTTPASPSRNVHYIPNPTLTWSRVSGMPYANYQLEVATTSSFGPSVVYQNPFLGDNVQLDSLHDGLYYWRVRACNMGVCGSWSAVDTFTIQFLPTIPAP